MRGCLLCNLPVKEGPYCCVGCEVVHAVLGGVKGNVEQHPLYVEALKKGEERKESGERKQIHFEIKGMWCPACARAIEWLLRRKKGVVACEVDYATDLASMEFVPEKVGESALFGYIKKLGYEASLLWNQEERALKKKLSLRLFITLFCALNVMMFSIPLYTKSLGEGFLQGFGIISCLFAVPLVTYGAAPLWRRFLVSLKTRYFGMESLVLLGTTAAFLLSVGHLIKGQVDKLYFDSLGMLMVSVLFGKALASRAKFSSKKALFYLSRLLPQKGRKVVGGEYIYVPLKQVAVGDVLCVLGGERVVLDGEVVGGEGSVDEAIMTGEAFPQVKREGDRLIAGSHLFGGSLTFKVTSLQEKTELNHILNLVKRGLQERTQQDRRIERLLSYFVPGVFVLAVTLFLFLPWQEALLRSASLCLIACPCAIGIAIPLAEAFLIQAFAKKGAIVRNRLALSKLAGVSHVVFDKTGTLTTGEFTLKSGVEVLSQEEKRVVRALAAKSHHPVAIALYHALDEPPCLLEKVCVIVGKGIEGVHQGKRYCLGSCALFSCPILEETSQDTIAYFGTKEEVRTRFTFGDTLKPEAKSVCGALKNVSLFSGDLIGAVKQTAEACAISNWKAECTPEEKKEGIQALGVSVAMVGDGINDTPAFMAADVSFAVEGAADLTASVADILLTKKALKALPQLIALAKKGERVVRSNLFWAFCYNILGLALAASGLLTPLFAAGAMVLSSLCVLINTARLRSHT